MSVCVTKFFRLSTTQNISSGFKKLPNKCTNIGIVQFWWLSHSSHAISADTLLFLQLYTIWFCARLAVMRKHFLTVTLTSHCQNVLFWIIQKIKKSNLIISICYSFRTGWVYKLTENCFLLLVYEKWHLHIVRVSFSSKAVYLWQSFCPATVSIYYTELQVKCYCLVKKYNSSKTAVPWITMSGHMLHHDSRVSQISQHSLLRVLTKTVRELYTTSPRLRGEGEEDKEWEVRER